MCLYVGHDGELCQSGWTDRDAIRENVYSWGTRNHTLRLGGGADFTTERGTVGSHAWAWPDMPAVDSLAVIRYGAGALRLLASGAAMRWVE